MAQPSADFTAELADVVADLGDAERRLRALHDLAGYEELSTEVGNRLKRKANAIQLHKDSLAEILSGKLG